MSLETVNLEEIAALLPKFKLEGNGFIAVVRSDQGAVAKWESDYIDHGERVFGRDGQSNYFAAMELFYQQFSGRTVSASIDQMQSGWRRQKIRDGANWIENHLDVNKKYVYLRAPTGNEAEHIATSFIQLLPRTISFS